MTQFFIKTLTGKTIVIDMDPNESIFIMKQRIFMKEGIPPEQQVIIFLGEKMEDSKALKEYKYNLDVTAHLVLKLK